MMPNLHRKAYFNSMKGMMVQPSGKAISQSSENQKQTVDRHVKNEYIHSQQQKKARIQNKTNQAK